MFARARVMLGESVLKRIVRCLSRDLSRDIGQPTHFTHPDLLKEDEGNYYELLLGSIEVVSN